MGCVSEVIEEAQAAPRSGSRRIHPQLRDAISEAALILDGLNSQRLEELAMSCRLLSRDPVPEGQLQTQVACEELSMVA